MTEFKAWRRTAGRSLKIHVALGVGLMAVLSIGAIGVNAERALSRETRQHVLDNLNELAFQMSYRLSRSMFERYRDIQIVSSLDAVRSGSVATRRSILDRIQETYRDYAWIGLASANGRVIASTGGLLESEDVSQRPWFIAGLNGPFVGDVHEAALLATLLPQEDGESLRFVDLAAPVLDIDGRVVGVVGAHLNWAWASEILNSMLQEQSAGRDIEIYLLGQDGTILLGPRDSIGKSSPCVIPSSASSGTRGAVLRECEDGRDYLIGYATTTSYRSYPGLGWSVLIREPSDIALAPVSELRRELLFSAVGLSIVLMIGGWFFAEWVGRPLREISLAAERLRRGDLTATLPTSTRFAEITSLTQSLSSLIGDLLSTQEGLKRTVEESERQHRFRSAIVENMRDGLFVNKGGKIVFVNNACLQLFGASSPDQLIGRSPLELFHSDCHAQIEERIRTLNEPGAQVPTVEETIIRLDGEEVEVEVTAVAFIDDGDRAILVILHDLTSRKKTERQLAHSQRMEAVGQLTGGMAHDFNNMLAIVIGNLELLDSQVKEHPVARRRVESALKASLRGADLTRQLLAFSRRQTLAPKAFDVNELVSSTTDLLSRTLGERIEVQMRLAEDLWLAHADQTQLESAVANLAINARDAMPEGGILKIETSNTYLDEQYAWENVEVEPGEYVLLAVSDTGTGIPQDILARVFDPFFTTKAEGKGSGLGLSMIYGFVKQSGGHIKIYSESGHGTTVRLYLPRAKGEDQSDMLEGPIKHIKPAPETTILVVEDKAEVRGVVVSQLQELGYQVIEAENVPAALDVITSDDRIDLLFTDIVMPGNRTGVDLAVEARRNRPDLKVIFTSGFSTILNGNKQQADMIGPLLSKPYRKQDLARKIQEVLQRPGDPTETSV